MVNQLLLQLSYIGIINESYKLRKVVVGHAAVAAWLSSSRNCQSQRGKTIGENDARLCIWYSTIHSTYST